MRDPGLVEAGTNLWVTSSKMPRCIEFEALSPLCTMDEGGWLMSDISPWFAGNAEPSWNESVCVGVRE